MHYTNASSTTPATAISRHLPLFGKSSPTKRIYLAMISKHSYALLSYGAKLIHTQQVNIYFQKKEKRTINIGISSLRNLSKER